MLNTNNLTQKSMEAISTAQSIAVSYQNMNIEQQHILLALLQAEDGLIPQLIKKMGVDASQLTRLCVLFSLVGICSFACFRSGLLR